MGGRRGEGEDYLEEMKYVRELIALAFSHRLCLFRWTTAMVAAPASVGAPTKLYKWKPPSTSSDVNGSLPEDVADYPRHRTNHYSELPLRPAAIAPVVAPR
ncbi:hypothetical protein LINPERPRIM_LOCUS38679, partial [Linum perenne]